MKNTISQENFNTLIGTMKHILGRDILATEMADLLALINRFMGGR